MRVWLFSGLQRAGHSLAGLMTSFIPNQSSPTLGMCSSCRALLRAPGQPTHGWRCYDRSNPDFMLLQPGAWAAKPAAAAQRRLWSAAEAHGTRCRARLVACAPSLGRPGGAHCYEKGLIRAGQLVPRPMRAHGKSPYRPCVC